MYPKEYIDYLVHFHGDRDYFECHELLEEYWKKTDTANRTSVWVGFIQLAVSQYHYRRGNINGAQRTLSKAIAILSLTEAEVSKLGIDMDTLHKLLASTMNAVKKQQPYESLQLPLASASLIHLCQHRAKELGLNWQDSSNMNDDDLIHRHTRRDRSSVIEERKKALLSKKRQ